MLIYGPYEWLDGNQFLNPRLARFSKDTSGGWVRLLGFALLAGAGLASAASAQTYDPRRGEPSTYQRGQYPQNDYQQGQRPPNGDPQDQYPQNYDQQDQYPQGPDELRGYSGPCRWRTPDLAQWRRLAA
jgi:hypothetical protein